MNIIYFHQYFNTPNEPGSTRSYWICKHLVNKGHKLTVITSRKANSKYKIGEIDNINIIYLNVKYNQKMNFFRRIFSFLLFTIKASFISFKIPNIDLVIATSTPLTIGIPALILKKYKKIPYIFEVRDLWPEVPIQMGILKNFFLIKISKFLEKTIYINSLHVISLSPGMENGVLKYIDKTKSTVIPNMSKIDQFYPRAINDQLFSKFLIKKKAFKIIYFGAMGNSNGLDNLMFSIKLFDNNPDYQFIFLGDGSKKEELINFCKTQKIDNVLFLNPLPMNETSELVNLCDVVVVSFLNLPILYTNSPNKLFDSLSAGKPILVNSSGWTKDLVEDAFCGFYFNPNNPLEFKEKVFTLSNNRKMIELMCNNSRALAESKFDKDILCEKYVNLIDNLFKL